MCVWVCSVKEDMLCVCVGVQSCKWGVCAWTVACVSLCTQDGGNGSTLTDPDIGRLHASHCVHRMGGMGDPDIGLKHKMPLHFLLSVFSSMLR